MKVLTDFIEKCCTTRENVDQLVVRAAHSIKEKSSTIVNILSFQSKALARAPMSPLLTPAELVQLLDRTDALDADFNTLISDSSNLIDLL